MRGFRYFLVAFFLALSIAARVTYAHAQTQVVLGNASVELTGPWKFHTGDNPQWASPSFDDSGWGTMDLTPPPGSSDPMTGRSGFVPGWTAHGYSGYSGYAWYRLRVNVQETAQSANVPLALKMPDSFDSAYPDSFDSAYEVYVNGQMIGNLGRFTVHGVTNRPSSQPRAFSLPSDMRSSPMTVAIRMWMGAGLPLFIQDAGGLHGPPVLGHTSIIHALLRLDWDATDREFASVFLEDTVLLLALLVAFGLYWMDRTEPAYLWLGLAYTAILFRVVIVLLTSYTSLVSPDSDGLVQALLFPGEAGLWVLFWGYWFRFPRMAWMHRVVWCLAPLLAAAAAMLRAPLYGRVVPIHAGTYLLPLIQVLELLFGALLVWVTVRGIRRDKAEGWLALSVVALKAISLYQGELSVLYGAEGSTWLSRVLHVPLTFFPFGFRITAFSTSTIFSLVIIMVLLLRRFLQGQRQREQWKLEMEQARQVQQLLVPATTPNTPGFAVESVYIPASEVGGDFFQVQPGEDGSLLVIVGDVSGKGLKAAMTVSTIVGALRAYPLRAPAEVLASLNRVVHGQINGFVTCCATLITADGKLTIANAGHLSPYRNGEEMAASGGLPLGIVEESSYEETHYQLAPGDRLTFMSDGVVEARNAKGELYGFERTQQISNRAAATIAETAKQFGQEDDITVVGVTRTLEAIHAGVARAEDLAHPPAPSGARIS